MDKQDHKKTLVIANALRHKYPEKEGYKFPRGVASLELDKIGTATNIAEEFLRNDSNSLDGLRLKGRIFLKQGLGDSAVHYLSKAMLQKADGRHMYLLGIAQNLTGDHKQAINNFNYSLGELNEYSIYRARAIAYVGLGDTATALQDFKKAIEIAPNDPENWNTRGFHLWLQYEQYQKALEDFDQAIKLSKNYAYFFNNRAWARFNLGDTKGAYSDLKLSEKRVPNNPFLHRNKGLIALAEGNPKACAHLLRAIELGYTRYHKDDISKLLKEHCPDMPVPEPPPEKEVKEAPKKPTRSNAPGG